MTPELTRAADALRQYLDQIGFSQVYKFIVSTNLYATAPSMVSRSTAGQVELFFDSVLGGQRDLLLLQCLLFGRAVPRAALSETERAVATALISAKLLAESEDRQSVVAGGYQLISAFGSDLLLDRRIHFGGGVHEVYVGPDSYLLLYYVDVAKLRPEHRAVDLCTGTGIGGLYLSQFCQQVLATDIGSAPLALAHLNRRLNGRDHAIDIRNQNLEQTLDGSEQFDLLTCNPPFVASPPSLQSTLYARGTDADGLGYLRSIIGRLPTVLTPGGCAYLVADLVGDQRGPHFVAELREFARAQGFAVDVYIDNVIAAEAQVGPMSAYLERLNPGRTREEIALAFREFQRSTLRAERYYMSTLKLRAGAGQPDVRVLRRYSLPRRRGEESWPAVLRA